MIVLRIVHILSGIFWVGALVFMSLFLMPALAGVGPAAGKVMAELKNRRLLTVLPIVAVLTMLSGFRLLSIVSGGSMGAYMQTTVGRMFATSGAVAILGFLVGVTFSRPVATRLAVLGAELQKATDDSTRARLTAELDVVQKRGVVWGMVTIVLLSLAAAGMASARYLG